MSKSTLDPDAEWDLENGESSPGQSAAALVQQVTAAALQATREPETKHQLVKVRIGRTPSVKSALAVARKGQAMFQAKIKELSRFFNREAYLEAHRRVILTSKNAD